MPSRAIVMVMAAGMAVSTHAQDRSTNLSPTSAENLERNARLIDRQRVLVREGKLDWRKVVSPRVLDDRIPPAPRARARGATSLRHNVNQPWGALIDANDFVLDFEDPAYQITTLDPTSSSPFISLAGVVDPNTGDAWGLFGDASGYVGIVDNAAAMTGARWDPDGADDDPLTEGVLDGDPDQHGEVGGPDPLGVHGKFLAAAAGSMATQAPLDFGSRLQGWLTHKFYLPSIDEPVVTIVDIYADREDSSTWYSPLSEIEGNLFAMSSYWFGYTFSQNASLADPDNVIRRPMILAYDSTPEIPGTGEFYVHPASSPWRAKTDEWFSIAIRQTYDGYSYWVRDSQTIGVNGFEQDSLYDGITGVDDPSGTRGAFAGEIFESDWLQLTPGVDDDPSTSVIEGYGVSRTAFGKPHLTTVDSTGSSAAPNISAFQNFPAVGIDAIHWRGGFDPGPTYVPTFVPNDVYLDNYVVLGEQNRLRTLTPDKKIPFSDDLELWGPHVFLKLGGDWDEYRYTYLPELDGSTNITPGGTQSFRHSALGDDNYITEILTRNNLLTVTATDTVPVVVQTSMRLSGTSMSRILVIRDTTERHTDTARLIFGARDALSTIDDRIYVQQRNPLYDSTISEPEDISENRVDDGVANMQKVAVPLVDSTTLTPLSIPVGSWFDVRVEVLEDATGNNQHPLTMLFDFGSGWVEGVADGSVRGITSLRSSTPSVSQVEWRAGYEPGAAFQTMHIDDLFLDGPRSDDQYNVEVESVTSTYDDDPPFVLPYVDDLSSYEIGRPIDNRGTTEYGATLINDTMGAIDVVDVDSPPVAGITPVVLYTIEEPELDGTLPGGPYSAGDTVAVVDNLLPEKPDWPLGTSAWRIHYRDGARVRQAVAECSKLADSAPWDGVTPVIGRYQFKHAPRWTTEQSQVEVIQDPTGSGRGAMIRLEPDALVTQYNSGYAPALSLQAPVIAPYGGVRAMQQFDLFLSDGTPSDGPRGRIVWPIYGRYGPSISTENLIARVVFGGPDNFEDLMTFDDTSGDITPGPDGYPDDFQFDDFQGDPTHIFLEIPNPFAGSGGSFPDTILIDTGDTMALNTWVQCTATVDALWNWEITLDDGVSPKVYTGSSLESPPQNPGSSIDRLVLEVGVDPGSTPLTELSPIRWYSLGAFAAPEGGLSPLTQHDSSSGSFNDTRQYFYYGIGTILDPGNNLPDVADINGTTTRTLSNFHVIGFWNDQSTVGMGGPVGAPIDPHQTPRNTRWEMVDPSDHSVVLARGTWGALGRPRLSTEDPTYYSTAPYGGIVNLSPPYNGPSSLRSILMATMVDPPQPTDFRAQPFRVYIDNIVMREIGCLGDLSLDNSISGVDLGLLLGQWQQPGLADLNGDGTTDGADLGLLLGAWGPCP
ncbi:MAG: hypothetical protein ACF8GE_12000 [Phycisphaerales bacterium JB043]